MVRILVGFTYIDSKVSFEGNVEKLEQPALFTTGADGSS